MYVGKVAHGSYYDQTPPDIGGGCGYFWDYRRPDISLNSWHNLIDLTTTKEEWLVDNRNIFYSPTSNPLNETAVISGYDSCGIYYKTCSTFMELLTPKCIGPGKVFCK